MYASIMLAHLLFTSSCVSIILGVTQKEEPDGDLTTMYGKQFTQKTYVILHANVDSVTPAVPPTSALPARPRISVQRVHFKNFLVRVSHL